MQSQKFFDLQFSGSLIRPKKNRNIVEINFHALSSGAYKSNNDALNFTGNLYCIGNVIKIERKEEKEKTELTYKKRSKYALIMIVKIRTHFPI